MKLYIYKLPVVKLSILPIGSIRETENEDRSAERNQNCGECFAFITGIPTTAKVLPRYHNLFISG